MQAYHMTMERRLDKRHQLGIDAVIITPTASVPVHTVDISTSGIRVTSPRPVLPETDIALSLATENETLLSGSVLWALEFTGNDGAPYYELGIDAHAFILRDREAIGFTDKEATVLEIISRVRQSADS